MKTLSSKEDEFSLSLKVNCLIMVVMIISVMRMITSLTVNFLRITFYTFIKTEDCDSNSEEGDNWSFAALNLGGRIISSNHCLTLFLVSKNEDVGDQYLTGWFFNCSF